MGNEATSSNCTQVQVEDGECADWLIGEDVWNWNSTDLPGLRNMADPAQYGDKDHYLEWDDDLGDNGGVHTNSGIPNHAYYLLVNGGKNAGCAIVADHPHTDDCSVNVSPPGIGLADAEQIFYLAFTALPSNATMSNARDATVAMACMLFGEDGLRDGDLDENDIPINEPKSTSDAWLAVGLTNTTTPLCPPTDITAPTVTIVDPPHTATGVNPGTDVVITFSEPVNGVDNITFTLKKLDGSNITGAVTVAADRQSATFDPTNSLPDNTDINVTVDMAVTDDSGNNLDPSFNSTFTTGTTPVVIGPKVTQIIIWVEQKGPNYQAIAQVYADQDTLIEGDFFDLNGDFLNSDSGTVGEEGFVRLQSKKVRAGDVFTISITNPKSGVTECSVSEGTCPPLRTERILEDHDLWGGV